MVLFSDLIISENRKRHLCLKILTDFINCIWGNKPELFYKIAREITQEYEFDGLDIVGQIVQKEQSN